MKQHISGLDRTNAPRIVERLDDVGELRLREMDEAGIDLQVLSLPIRDCRNWMPRPPSGWRAASTTGSTKRFGRIPTGSPLLPQSPLPIRRAAADELERTVTKLGFKGALVNGLTNGLFLDDKRFWPIFERAQALDVPLYMHPSTPHPAVIEAYYKDYVRSTLRCCAPPGASRSRPRRRAFAWY